MWGALQQPLGVYSARAADKFRSCARADDVRFTDAVNRAKKADALIQVTDTQELEETIAHLLCNKDFCNAKCSLAYNWAASENKVLENIMDKVKGFI